LTLTDSSNREYLDFTAGIAVTALGHSDPEYTSILSEQAGQLSHASNVYWNEHAGELAKALIEGTRQHGGLGLSKSGGAGGKVFFSNSGTEANEGALKFARKYGKEIAEKNGKGTKDEIVCFTNAFHGRSMGALSVTPNPKYQGPFAPLIPGVKVGKYNDWRGSEEETNKVVDALITEETCGVIVEPIQGEGGVGTANVEWLSAVGRRCKEVGAVLIYDEIQVSFGSDIEAPLTPSVASSGRARCGPTPRSPPSRSPTSSPWPSRSRTDSPSEPSWSPIRSPRSSASARTARPLAASPSRPGWACTCCPV
jgi:acetylornithine aminotransferase